MASIIQPLAFCCDRGYNERVKVNPLVPSDPYMGRTAQLTSRRILNAYSTNIRTEYFKYAA
jgi:hypothetical protein